MRRLLIDVALGQHRQQLVGVLLFLEQLRRLRVAQHLGKCAQRSVAGYFIS